MKLTARQKAYIFLVLNAILWGVSPVIIKDSFDNTTPFRFLFIRFAIASALTLPLFIDYYFKLKNSFFKFLKIIIIGESIGTTLILVLLYIGLNYTSAIEAGLIATTAPIFITIAGVKFLNEKTEKSEIRGLLLALFGSILLALVPLFYNTALSLSLLGSSLILLQNMLSGVYSVYLKRYYLKIPKLFVVIVSFWVGFVSFLILSIIESNGVGNLISDIETDLGYTNVIFASSYMAILGSIVAYYLLQKGQSLIEVSEASLFIYIQPLFFIPLAIVWLDESIHIVQVVAMIIILVGVYLANFKNRKIT